MAALIWYCGRYLNEVKERKVKVFNKKKYEFVYVTLKVTKHCAKITLKVKILLRKSMYYLCA